MKSLANRPQAPLSEQDKHRFFSKVGFTAQKDKCWEWLGEGKHMGYGRFFITTVVGEKGKTYFAQRVSYFLHTGIDPIGKSVLHKCDNPGCVNPNHLFLGDPKDNTDDMMSKGRGSMQFEKGSSHSGAKLSDQDVIRIRLMKAQGNKQSVIAIEYGADGSLISLIVNRKRWKHI